MTDLHTMAVAERAAVAEDLERLSEEDWGKATVCDPWTVRHLVAHMTGLGHQTPFGFVTGLIGSGFSFDKFMGKVMATHNVGTNADVLGGFRKTLTKQKPPPGPKYVALGEYLIHGEDIRRAVGITRTYPEAHLVALADAYKTTGKPLNGKQRVEGLKLTATDASWTSGNGPEVRGPLLDLVLAISGRRSALENCTGDGVATLRSRN